MRETEQPIDLRELGYPFGYGPYQRFDPRQQRSARPEPRKVPFGFNPRAYTEQVKVAKL